MKTDKVFYKRELLHPIRFLIWLVAIVFDRAEIGLWVRQHSNPSQTTREYYIRVFRVKVPLFTKYVHHFEHENFSK